MNELLPCPFCGKLPGTKVGPPAMARCIAEGCEGRSLAAVTVAEWNTRPPSLVDRETTPALALWHPTEYPETGGFMKVCFSQALAEAEYQRAGPGWKIVPVALSLVNPEMDPQSKAIYERATIAAALRAKASSTEPGEG